MSRLVLEVSAVGTVMIGTLQMSYSPQIYCYASPKVALHLLKKLRVAHKSRDLLFPRKPLPREEISCVDIKSDSVSSLICFHNSGAIKNHYEMIKQFKGVPGVKPDRFAEGFSIKHCALSLVGEPIMYPEINKFCTMLHEKGISSFLVTNAQFPDAIKSLVPVTQLYVSVDAGTKESLKKIDRPLFKDFWPRFIDSLKALSDKGQRTVYRLTVVKAWNSDEIEAYAKLVQLGRPDFIEIKGVTFCGDSKSDDGLTMKNVPWHEEVRHFVSMLVDMLDDYAIACEHEHSNCVLVAQNKFRSADGGGWRTWINYEKFHQLYQKWETTGETFNSMDYMDDTPSWALVDSKERGFDPAETRWRRKTKVTQGC